MLPTVVVLEMSLTFDDARSMISVPDTDATISSNAAAASVGIVMRYERNRMDWLDVEDLAVADAWTDPREDEMEDLTSRQRSAGMFAVAPAAIEFTVLRSAASSARQTVQSSR